MCVAGAILSYSAFESCVRTQRINRGAVASSNASMRWRGKMLDSISRTARRGLAVAGSPGAWCLLTGVTARVNDFVRWPAFGGKSRMGEARPGGRMWQARPRRRTSPDRFMRSYARQQPRLDPESFYGSAEGPARRQECVLGYGQGERIMREY